MQKKPDISLDKKIYLLFALKSGAEIALRQVTAYTPHHKPEEITWGDQVPDN